jgi:hypothetical protein
MATNRIAGTKTPAQFARERAPGMRIDSGPYLAEVKDNADQLFHGRLRVYIPEFGGNPDDDKSWFTVNYASPFFGEVNPYYEQQKTNKKPIYGQTLQSYGMWFVPPDLGVTVLVTFAVGNPDLGYWFACVPTPRGHQMVPGIAGSSKYQESGAATKADFPQAPVAEAVIGDRDDFLNSTRPVHTAQFDIVRNQGIAGDPARGVITSSSQRESPSRVFGISTPGRPDPDPAFGSDQIQPDPGFIKKIAEASNGASSQLAKELFLPKARKGGHTLVMDDGDITGNSQLVRLRSATGHQILMNDSEGLIYIINAAGTSWVEMTPDGSINVYSGGDVSMRAKGSMNFHADENIRFHAGGNITMKAVDNVIAQGTNISLKAEAALIADGQTLLLVSDGAAILHGDGSLMVSSGGDLNISGSVDISSSGGSKPGSGVDVTTREFPESEKSGEVWRNSGGNATESSVGVLPTHEPWNRPAKQIDQRAIQRLNSISENANISPNTTVNRAAVASANFSSLGGAAASRSNNAFTSDGTALQSTPKGSRITAEQIDAQPDPPNPPIGNLTPLQTKALFAQLALRESGLRYQVAGGVTTGGAYTGNYLGKYQLGSSALVNAGYISQTCLDNEYKNNPTYAVRSDACWTGKNGVNSKTDFLNNPAAQEDAMHSFTKKQYTALVTTGAIRSGDTPEEVMGKLTTAHLIGSGGATKLFKTGIDSNDANGTWGKSYYELGRHAANVADNMVYRQTLAQNKTSSKA